MMDEDIDLFYDKVEKQGVEAVVSDLESQAIAEARANCGIIKLTSKDGISRNMTEEEFDKFSDYDIECVICTLGQNALTGLNNLAIDKLQAVTTPLIAQCPACALFQLIGRIEKLDGTLNTIVEKVSFELPLPIGTGRSLMKYYMMLIKVYPWISISETKLMQNG